MTGFKPSAVSRRFLITALLSAVVLLFLQTLLRPDYLRRNVRVFTEMVRSRASESQSASAVFANGATQQALVAGVVEYRGQPLRYGPGPDEAQRAGRELISPLAADDGSARAKGAELYRIYCVPCHAADGGGRGPVVRRGMLPPPSLLAARARSIADGEIFHILSRGQGNMASYAAQLTPTERWGVIAHLRAMQEQQ